MLVNANALRIPLADGMVQVCVTSPPYFGLRDYQVAGQLGLEESPEEYIANLVAVGREVWRVLREDGTWWLNLGDSYAGGGNYRGINSEETLSAKQRSSGGARGVSQALGNLKSKMGSLKPKDLMMIPARVAIALQADGWWLRAEIVWGKANPMPESCTDRPTRSHEMIYLLTKNKTYYYDNEAVKEVGSIESVKRLERGISDHHKNISGAPGQSPHTFSQPRQNIRNAGGNYSKRYADAQLEHGGESNRVDTGTRNQRDVWTLATEPYSGAHYATFPTEIPRRAILAGTSAKGHCAKCGQGWVRVVNSKSENTRPNSRRDGIQFESEIGAGHTNGLGKTTLSHRIHNQTLGWRTVCTCNAEHDWLDIPTDGYSTICRTCGINSSVGDTPCVVPALVLDPFVGSGTTGQVARELGRRFVGIDLSMKYLRENALPRSERTQTEESIQSLPLFSGG